MTPFIKILKEKYPEVDVEKAISIYEKKIETISMPIGGDIAMIKINSDLAKNIFISSMSKYLNDKSVISNEK